MKKYYTLLFTAVITLLLFSTITVTSCKKLTCFSQELYDKHKGDICHDNCPGVIGCDGKQYCNTCYAMREGIAVP